MNRRHFLATATAAALVPRSAAAGLLSVARKPLSRIGIQLYAVRGAAARDLEQALADLAAIGYKEVELLSSFGNFGKAPSAVRAVLDRVGLQAPSTHANAKVVIDGWDRTLDEAATLGHQYVTVWGFSAEEARTLDDWKKWADRFNAAGAVARRRGIWLGFHCEPDQFKPIDGQVPYDAFISRTDPTVTRHQLDIGNAAMAGVDPMSLLTKYRDRYWSFHVKDVPVMGKVADTELGRGVVNLKKLLAAVPSPETKHFFVEQEGEATPMESARKNYAYLKALEL
jgi:sugar phosphate isomerase/epimerase